jgi:hypothetical protein
MKRVGQQTRVPSTLGQRVLARVFKIRYVFIVRKSIIVFSGQALLTDKAAIFKESKALWEFSAHIQIISKSTLVVSKSPFRWIP